MVRTIIPLVVWEFEMLEILDKLGRYSGIDSISREPVNAFIRLKKLDRSELRLLWTEIWLFAIYQIKLSPGKVFLQRRKIRASERYWGKSHVKGFWVLVTQIVPAWSCPCMVHDGCLKLRARRSQMMTRRGPSCGPLGWSTRKFLRPA